MYLSQGDWEESVPTGQVLNKIVLQFNLAWVPAGQCLLVKFVCNRSVMYLSWGDWKKSLNNYLSQLR